MSQKVASSIAILTGLFLAVAPVGAQQATVPAIFDSPTAQTLLDDARTQASANPSESARLIRRLLDEYPLRLVRTADPREDLHRSAAIEAESFLLANPQVLARFRELESRSAERMLADLGPEAVSLRRCLTRAGLSATLQLAEGALRSGRTEECLELVGRIRQHPDLAGREQLALHAIEAICERDRGASGDAARALVAAIASDPAEAALARDASAALALIDRTAPRLAADRVRSPLTTGSPSAVPGGDWREIWSLELDESAFRRIFGGAVGLINPRNVERARLDANWMTAAPTVVDRTIYVSEGLRVRAIDADSREERWSRELGVAAVEREFGGIGDLSSVVYDQGAVFVFEGHAFSNARTAGGRIWSLDAETGRTRWVVRIGDDDDGQREELQGLFPVGSPLVFGDTVLVLMRKPTQRLEQVDWVLGLDRDTGAVRWADILAGSAGTRAIGGRRHAGATRIEHGAVVATPLGVIGRLRGADGVFEWLRRFPVPLRDPRFVAEPWEMGGPAVVGDRVVAITPDELEIVALDARSGALLESRPLGPGTSWESPRYLLSSRTSDGLELVLGVGSDLVAFEGRDLSKRLWRLSDRLAESGIAQARLDNRSGIRGRVTAAGDRLMVPCVDRLLFVDVRTGRIESQIEGERPGNPVLLDDRIIVAGDEMLRVLMPPDRAEAILRARLAASPDEPAASLALVDLTLATGRPTLALESARVLESAVARGFGDERLRSDAVDRLIDIARRHPELGDESFAIATRLATASGLRVRLELARGDFLLGAGRAPEAVACWRALSCDPQLGAELVARGSMQRAVRGEALGRLAQFASRDVELAGLLERDAESAVAALADASRTPTALSQVALAHPRTLAGARAVLDAVAGGARDELLFAAMMDALVPPARLEVVELLEDAIVARAEAAAGAAGSAAARRRVSELLVASGQSRPDLSELPWRNARVGRNPVLGVDLPARLLRTEGDRTDGFSPDAVLLMQGGALTRFSLDNLTAKWSLRLDDRDPLLLWSRERVVVWQSVQALGESALVVDPDSGVPTRPSIRVGELWEAAKLITPDQPDSQFSPDGSSFQPSRIRPHCDGRSLHLVRANGDVARVDLVDARAQPRAKRKALGIVFASALEHGLLILGGRDGSRADQRSVVLVLDSATLEERARFEVRSGTDVRWLQSTPLGELYVGTVGGVEGWRLAPEGGARPFLVTTDSSCVQTGSPVLLGASIVVRDRVDVPLRIPLLGGDPAPIPMPAEPLGRSRTIRGLRAVKEGLLIHAEDRLLLLAHDGSTIGVDSSPRERNFVFALPADGQIVQIDGLGARQVGEDLGVARMEFGYIAQSLSPSAGLRMDAEPFEFTCPNQRADRAFLADGWLLLSNSMGTSAVQLPIEEVAPETPPVRK